MCSCCCCSLSFELGKMLIRWNSKLEFFIAWCYVYDGFCDWHIVASVGNFATGGWKKYWCSVQKNTRTDKSDGCSTSLSDQCKHGSHFFNPTCYRRSVESLLATIYSLFWFLRGYQGSGDQREGNRWRDIYNGSGAGGHRNNFGSITK